MLEAGARIRPVAVLRCVAPVALENSIHRPVQFIKETVPLVDYGGPRLVVVVHYKTFRIDNLKPS